MPATIPNSELNALADAYAARVGALSVHTASPETTGANEATGGTPAYARKAPTFSAAGAQGPLGATAQPATPGVAWSSQVTFDLPAGSFTHVGLWDAVGGTAFRGGQVFAATQTLSANGQLKVSVGVGPFAPA